MTNKSPNLQKTFLEFQKGSHEAFETIFDQYANRVHAFIRKFVRTDSVAEELMQDTFLQLWRYKERIVSADKIPNFLFRVGKNAALDALAKERSRANYERERRETITTPIYNQADELEANQLSEQIEVIVSNMPEQRQRIFRYSRFREFEVNEIAEKLNISPKTVYAHIYSAIDDLERELDGYL